MNFVRVLCVLLGVSLISWVWAVQPTLPTTLEERVEKTPIIFVGEVRNVYLTNKNGKRISVQRAVSGTKGDFTSVNWPHTEYKIHVVEALKGRFSTQRKVVLLRRDIPVSFTYHRDQDEISAMKRDVWRERKQIGKTLIFFAEAIAKPAQKTLLVPSNYHGYIFEPLSQKRAIQKAIAQMKTRKKTR